MAILAGALARLAMGVEILKVMRQKAQDGHLSFVQQSSQMLRLKFTRRQSFRFYLMARMWRKHMSWQDKSDHFSYADYQWLVDTLNPPQKRKDYRQKYQQKKMLVRSAVSTSHCLGCIHASFGETFDGKPLTNLTELEGLLRKHINERLVFKRLLGSGGDGFLSGIVELIGDTIAIRHPLNGFMSSLDEFYQRLGKYDEGYIIEAHVSQHSVLVRLNPDSLNTLRIWVTNEGNEPRVLGSFLRIGRKNVMVDNTSAGGLICTVNDESGALQELSTGDYWRQTLLVHPDTRIDHSGIALPFYQEAKSLALQALAAFPEMGLAGLDIAITANGPTVIEINVDNPAQIGTACFDKPGRQLFPRLFN